MSIQTLTSGTTEESQLITKEPQHLSIIKVQLCWPGFLPVLRGDPRGRHSGQDQGRAPGHRGQRAETPGRGEAGPAGAACAPDQVTCREGSRGCGHARPLPRRVSHPRGLRPGQILLSGSRIEMCQRLHSSRKYSHHIKELKYISLVTDDYFQCVETTLCAPPPSTGPCAPARMVTRGIPMIGAQR